MGRRISKEFLHPSILEGVNDKIGNLDSLETDAKGNMVQAINELVEKLDNSAEIENGKELIANAVGEPLTAEESFDEMSNDINGLLSTFKTNMMNNGITVESGDKFKALIDKIATLADSEGKGIQFAEGTQTFTYNIQAGRVLTVNTNLNFTPTHVFATFTPFSIGSLTYRNYIMSNIFNFSTGQTYANRAWISEVTSKYFKISTTDGDDNNTYITYDEDATINWWAIGVGEEDTTLRDSLASILENKGVDVTEEDDMATLIEYVNKCSFDADVVNMGGDTVDLKSSTTGKYTFNHSIGHTNYKFKYDITGSYAYTTDSTKYANAPFEGSLEMSDITKTLTHTQSFNMWASDNYGSLDTTIIITKYNDKVEFDFTITNNSNNVVISVLDYVISSSTIIYMK
jgi:hypothetical protein